MKDKISLSVDGETVEASQGETLWDLCTRNGKTIPHLCHKPDPGYRPDGNCRACLVEVDGERALVASCVRTVSDGMVVTTSSDRVVRARRGIFDLLMADQPPRSNARDKTSSFWSWSDFVGVKNSSYPARKEKLEADKSHKAMTVNLDACIHCNLCVRACRELQVNDVIGMSGRGAEATITFDLADPMGESTCVACGECVQACPTGALMPSTLVDETGKGDRSYDQQVNSVCPYCGVGCQITYNLRAGRIVSVDGRDGPANENRLCVKGRFGFDYINHPDRLTKPLIRKEGIEKPEHPTLDPSNPLKDFREASWEEALAHAAGGLVDIKNRSGSSALAGFGSAKCSNEEAYLFQKLVRTGFGTNNVDHCTRLCHASSVAALLETIGTGAVTASFNEVKNADFVMVIGANPTENHPVAATYFKQAAKQGTILVVADPRGQALKRHADHMLQFAPGGDVSLLNGMMHVIVEEGLFDKDFIDRRTEGFEQLRHHLKDFTPEKMSAICGIAPEVIRTVARKYATAKAAMIFWGMGVSQHIHGTDNCRCLISLALMCGHVGKPGTGLHPLRGQNNVQGASDAGLIPMMYPNYGSVEKEDVRQKFEGAWKVDLDPKPGLTVVEIMDAIHRGQVQGMYIMGENPAMSDPDLNHARAALRKLDHLVVQDLFLTETAMYADVILPASAWPEKTGTVTNTNRQVQLGKAAVKVPGEARQDWEIIQDMAKGMALDWNYKDIADVYQEMASVMPSLNNISWDRLNAEGVVTYPVDAVDVPGHDVILDKVFPREGGRGLFVPADIVQPDEQPDEEYPMILTTGRQLEHWHTGAMTRRASVLDHLEPEPHVCLSPKDMRDAGLEAGDFAHVSTRRGRIKLRVRQDSGVPHGALFIPFAYVEAAANELTNPALDPFGKIPEFKFCAARIEKD